MAARRADAEFEEVENGGGHGGGRKLKVSSRKPRRGYPGPRGGAHGALSPLGPGSTLRSGRDDTGRSVSDEPYFRSALLASRAALNSEPAPQSGQRVEPARSRPTL
ncbi:hypothetical protein CSW63_05985 [Caulobacter sp. FWC26]|nr:hypothetical protein CSW63_05985 [Caulobacter sp. FWC26]